MTLDAGEETQASHLRSIVPLRGGKRFSQDIAHFVIGMPDRKLISVYFHGIVTLSKIARTHLRALTRFPPRINRYMDFINKVERR